MVIPSLGLTLGFERGRISILFAIETLSASMHDLVEPGKRSAGV